MPARKREQQAFFCFVVDVAKFTELRSKVRCLATLYLFWTPKSQNYDDIKPFQVIKWQIMFEHSNRTAQNRVREEKGNGYVSMPIKVR